MARDLAAGFQTVREEEVNAQLACLDAVRARASTQAWKHAAIDLMGPKPGDRIIEVGCGAGDDAQLIAASIVPDGSVVAVDSSEAMVVEARERAAGAGLPIEFRVGDALALDFADGAFDAAHAERLLVHVADGFAALRELVRVTRPGGRVVITEPDMETWLVDGFDDDVTRRMMAFLRASFADAWGGRRLVRWFHAAGLRDVECRGDASVWTEPDLVVGVMRLDEQVPRAVDARVLSAAEGAAWLEDLQRGPACFASATLFTCAGTVPG